MSDLLGRLGDSTLAKTVNCSSETVYHVMLVLPVRSIYCQTVCHVMFVLPVRVVYYQSESCLSV